MTTKDELDSQLLQLAILAQQNPPDSVQRRLALTKLMNAIIRSGRLCYPQRNQFPASRYQDIYDEARQELLLYVCQNIEKYSPERGSVLTWVNVLLERRFFKNARRKIHNLNVINHTTFPDLDNVITEEFHDDPVAVLKECLESDPDDSFKHEHIEKHPQLNFQVLARRRISGESWKEIAAEFDIKISTLSSFYYRCINKFADQLKQYCSEDFN